MLLDRFGTIHVNHEIEVKIVKLAKTRKVALKGAADFENWSREQVCWLSGQIDNRDQLLEEKSLHMLNREFNEKFNTCWNLYYYLRNPWKYWTRWSKARRLWLEKRISFAVDESTFDWQTLACKFNKEFGANVQLVPGLLTWHWVGKMVIRFNVKEPTRLEIRQGRSASAAESG